MVATIDIAGRKVGPGQHCFIVAEAGVNHNGSLEMARRLVDVAAEAGADAIKFQTFKADLLVSSRAPKAEYQVKTTGAGESQFEMLHRLELPSEVFKELQAYCQERGILFLSTPFEQESVDFLDELGVPIFKVASGDLTNLPFLRHMARKGKPMIISTGMATMEEVEEAVSTVFMEGNQQIALLHCVTNYPAEPAECNLRAMKTLAEAFKLPVGFSDHTFGIEISLAAVVMGARIIEKHVTIDKNLPGPDHQASLEPDEFQILVRCIRNIEKSLGDGVKRPVVRELDMKLRVRKSIVALADIAAGETLRPEVLAIKRPGDGISPKFWDVVIGKRTRRSVARDNVLSWDDVAWD